MIAANFFSKPCMLSNELTIIQLIGNPFCLAYIANIIGITLIASFQVIYITYHIAAEGTEKRATTQSTIHSRAKKNSKLIR
jgi:hypothetical protein